MVNVQIKDSDERRQIMEDLDTSMLVEAGAGSGKTYSMVQRMVCLVKEGKCSVGRIAAVTFTRKAAAELKAKFQLALEKELLKEGDSVKKERLSLALNEIERCFTGTIHSFCAGLLRERPVEAGLSPDFEELEEAENARIRKRVWENYLNRVQSETPELLNELRQLDVDAGDLEDCYVMLSDFPDVEVAREDKPFPDLKPVRRELNEFLEQIEVILPEKVPEKGWDRLQALVRKALRWRRLFGFEDDVMLLRLLVQLEKRGDITQNRWPDKERAKAAQKAFSELQYNYIIPALERWREYRHKKLVEFVLPGVRECELTKREHSRLSFQDLLIQAAELLKNNSEVRRYFQKRYTHLLVDEFQDTDPVQAEIMFYLTGQDVEEKDWRNLVPYPGSLFVVGDPKQSIYRFRRADIDMYNEVKQLMENGRGKVLRLTTNFRSLQVIGEWVNPVFSALLPEQADSYQAAFASLDAVREKAEEAVGGIKTCTVPKVKGDKRLGIARKDAQKIARWVRWALDGGISLSRSESEFEAGVSSRPGPGDFMIILRYKANMEIYARALEEEGIPFQIAGGGSFSGSEEMKELLKVLKCVIEPDNPVRLVEVLRGIFMGISDKQLWLFKKAGGEFSFLSDVPEDLNEEDKEIFSHAFGQLRLFREWSLSLPPGAALDNIIKELGVIPYTLGTSSGKGSCGHILHSRELLSAAERNGITSFSSLVEYLELLIESGNIEEEINITPWYGDTVRLMNLHKAKGLEAPVVFLANPGKTLNAEPDKYIDRFAGGYSFGYFTVQKKKGFKNELLAQPVNWPQYREIEQQYLDAEETRLLYVASTRAMDLLVISTYSGKPELSPWYKFNEYLEEVAELEEIESKDGSLIGGGIELTARDLEEARKTFLGANNAVCRPGYERVTVTSLSKGERSYPGEQATGRGRSWGIVLHRVLEALARENISNLNLFVENIISEEGRDTQEKEQVLKLAEAITKSPLWQRMLKSKKRHVEVPFSKKVPEDEAGYELETVISGVIDLVFREEGGWVLVDYKTDTVEGSEKLSELVRYYTPQVEMYKKFWEEISGEKVVEAGLYFIYRNEWVVINV